MDFVISNYVVDFDSNKNISNQIRGYYIYLYRLADVTHSVTRVLGNDKIIRYNITLRYKLLKMLNNVGSQVVVLNVYFNFNFNTCT